MIINKNKIIFFILLIALILTIVSFSALSGCSLRNMVSTTYEETSTLTLRDIDIDEKEINSIKTLDSEMGKNYDISKEISSIADELENPFKPFYFAEETDEVKNILILENIYLEEGSEYCELKFNDYKYILAENDTFNDVYMIQSINETSVVVLKGDDIFTLFIGEMVHD